MSRVYVTAERRAEMDRLRYHNPLDTSWLTAMPVGDDGDVALICVGCYFCCPADRGEMVLCPQSYEPAMSRKERGSDG